MTTVPTTVEGKIDKMLELYLTLDKKIDRDTLVSKEKINDLRAAHNKLVTKVVAQKAELVDTHIRVNELENRQMKSERELEITKSLVSDLVLTLGIVNMRLESVYIDLATEVKERKIILSGISESKNEDVKAMALDKIQKKSSDKQKERGFKGMKVNFDLDKFDASCIDAAY